MFIIYREINVTFKTALFYKHWEFHFEIKILQNYLLRIHTEALASERERSTHFFIPSSIPFPKLQFPFPPFPFSSFFPPFSCFPSTILPFPPRGRIKKGEDSRFGKNYQLFNYPPLISVKLKGYWSLELTFPDEKSA